MHTSYADKRRGTSADALLAWVLERAGKAQEVLLIDRYSLYERMEL